MVFQETLLDFVLCSGPMYLYSGQRREPRKKATKKETGGLPPLWPGGSPGSPRLLAANGFRVNGHSQGFFPEPFCFVEALKVAVSREAVPVNVNI